ncbi:MAG: hypothetical protein R8G33_09180 [Gammaproteobacteria bacterium]|nr:hypothetical protein [Gammaproteobacteria bacterium]
MNRIALVLCLLACILVVTACGQYGDLYAPTEDEGTAEQQNEDKE